MRLERIDQSLTAASLKTLDARLAELLGQPPGEGMSYVRFMDSIRSGLPRHSHRRVAAFERERLPFAKSFEQFDFSKLPANYEPQVHELRTFQFVHEAKNVIFLGPPGIGKTHMCVALAEEAVRKGIDLCFVTAYNLLADLNRARAEQRLIPQLRAYVAPRLLFIDDIGYTPLDGPGAIAILALVSARHERGSIVLSSNKSFREWRPVFGEPIISSAILHRLLPRANVIHFRANRYHCQSKGPGRSESLRISDWRPSLRNSGAA